MAGSEGLGHHAHEHPAHARDDVHAQPRSRQGLRRRAALPERLGVLDRLRRRLSQPRTSSPGGSARCSACSTARSSPPSCCPSCRASTRAWRASCAARPSRASWNRPGFLALNYGVRTPISDADRARRVRRDAGRLLLAGRFQAEQLERPGTASLASPQPGVHSPARLQRQRRRASVDASVTSKTRPHARGTARRCSARVSSSVNGVRAVAPARSRTAEPASSRTS